MKSRGGRITFFCVCVCVCVCLCVCVCVCVCVWIFVWLPGGKGFSRFYIRLVRVHRTCIVLRQNDG